MTYSVTKDGYFKGGIPIKFEELPLDIQKDIEGSEDFFAQLEAAEGIKDEGLRMEAIAQVCETHPYNLG